MPVTQKLLSVDHPFGNRSGLILVELEWSGSYTGHVLDLSTLGINGLTRGMFPYIHLLGRDSAADGKDVAIQNTLGVTGVTTANPGVVTTDAPHNLQTGDAVVIAGVGGAVQANVTTVATVLTATTFSIPINVTGTYTSGGTVTPTKSLRWMGVVRLYGFGGSTEASSTVATSAVIKALWRKF